MHVFNQSFWRASPSQTLVNHHLWRHCISARLILLDSQAGETTLHMEPSGCCLSNNDKRLPNSSHETANWLNQTTSSYHVFIVHPTLLPGSYCFTRRQPPATWQATPHPWVPEESLHAPHFVEFSPGNGTLMAVGCWRLHTSQGLVKSLCLFCKGGRLRFCCYMLCKYTLVYMYILYVYIYIYTSNLNHQLTFGWHSIYTVPSICPEDIG